MLSSEVPVRGMVEGSETRAGANGREAEEEVDDEEEDSETELVVDTTEMTGKYVLIPIACCTAILQFITMLSLWDFLSILWPNSR